VRLENFNWGLKKGGNLGEQPRYRCVLGEIRLTEGLSPGKKEDPEQRPAEGRDSGKGLGERLSRRNLD